MNLCCNDKFNENQVTYKTLQGKITILLSFLIRLCMSTLHVPLNLSFTLLEPRSKPSAIAEYERAPTMTSLLADGNQYLH